MTQRKQWILGFCMVLYFSTLFSTVNAMHIMEGFLDPKWCLIWGILCLPSLVLGIRKMNRVITKDQQLILLLVMAGAFSFVLSALKIPSVTGSSSHMTGLGFAAILFGPAISSVLGLIVLLFQALLLAHGGITTLGANVFSMGIIGPLATYILYRLFKKMNLSPKINVFLAVALGDLLTYVTTSLQLALAFPSESGGVVASLLKFGGIFAITQIPLAIIEGILTIVLLNTVTAYGKDLLVAFRKEVFSHDK